MPAEPVLANLQGYPVLVKTPEGTFIQVRPGAAVAGHGFSSYQENRTLIRVAPDFGGLIVYETPASIPAPEPPKVVVRAQLPQVDSAEPETVEIDNPSEYEAVLSALSAGISEPVVEEEPVAEVEPAQRKVDLTAQLVQTMSKRELIDISDALGLSTDGSRSQLVSRLSPYVGTTVALKG